MCQAEKLFRRGARTLSTDLDRHFERLPLLASAEFCSGLSRQISPSKVFNVSTRVVGLYLLRLSVTVGFRVP
jgi:hypothetical protein